MPTAKKVNKSTQRFDYALLNLPFPKKKEKKNHFIHFELIFGPKYSAYISSKTDL